MNPFKRKQTKGEPSLILDSCGLIDGRITDIARAGFTPQNIVIPKFIIGELQYLADNGDAHKRERARHGLDVARLLQEVKRIEVTIAREQFKNIKEVDDKLVALANQIGGYLYTTDYNLNKVAQIEGITVLNVNELAQAMRPSRLPGQQIEIRITQLGQDKTQGVGYLDDGTMVVVEKAAPMLGQTILVEFSRMLQTQAGKMMFAVLPQHKPQPRAPAPAQHEPREQRPVQRHEPRAPRPEPAVQVAAAQRPRPQVQTVYHAVPSRGQPPARAQQPAVAPEHPANVPRQEQRPEQPTGSRNNNARRRRAPQADASARQAGESARPAQQRQRKPQPRRKTSPEDSLLKALEERN